MIKMSFYHPYFERDLIHTLYLLHFKKQSETDKKHICVHPHFSFQF